MAPTRATVNKIHNALESMGVPHFHNRKPTSKHRNKIYVQTIHTSKGMDVDNAALVVSSKGDNFMLWGHNSDPRLLYVALTRAKQELYPLVIGDKVEPGLIDLMFSKVY